LKAFLAEDNISSTSLATSLKLMRVFAGYTWMYGYAFK